MRPRSWSEAEGIGAFLERRHDPCRSVSDFSFYLLNATRIKEFRARYNLTQQQLANLVNVRRETISYIENGNYNPSILLANRIAINLKSTIDELFIFEEKDIR